MKRGKKIHKDYYLNTDVVKMAEALLGQFIVTEFEGNRTVGMIVETEAYNGALDRASHAYNHRRTGRTETMYQEGGVAYVYLCYGIHHLFNIVTGERDNPQAVLIRAIEPIEGIDIMLKRRQMQKISWHLSNGPGVLTQALGITTKDNGRTLSKSPIWLEDRGVRVPPADILTSSRVGIDYAQEHRDLPWRFRIKHNPWIGK